MTMDKLRKDFEEAIALEIDLPREKAIESIRGRLADACFGEYYGEYNHAVVVELVLFNTIYPGVQK